MRNEIVSARITSLPKAIGDRLNWVDDAKKAA